MVRSLRVPASLPCVAEMGQHESGRKWLEALPEMLGELREMWGLRLEEPFHGGSCSWAAPARREAGPGAGEPLVLKVTWPHPEALAEAPGLALWAGGGAVRLHAYDPERQALLLERCVPGTELGRSHGVPADERLVHGADVLRDLWAAPLPPPGAEGPVLPGLADVTAQWADLAEERAARRWPAGVDTGLFALCAGLLRDLPGSAGREVLLHGDFNPGNVLTARRRPWLAIDPKPMRGDPAYDLWPLVEQVDDPFAAADPPGVLAHRTALVAGELGLDPQRVRAWAVARHVEYVLWSVVEDEDLGRSVGLMQQARLLAGLAGL
ncbi:aminoglycoside phosphotransferase family protein [Streptomyces sp. DSM 42041]|uniref:Aminoglycoside phosphotransferase family protein n=1 Tax=Streptomyces hazeniae TaxID=3075538 RepID=A0ABU2NTT7_9ACTN|nr:aminoglycoside phosphotransferase family protein [Streptomyces sp. DSM 42041]MDT0380140.1 aminoglycoside phosphotransferase family protein [Streptomyces sp. DSM 42041]